MAVRVTLSLALTLTLAPALPFRHRPRIEHDEFVMGHMGALQKARNIRRDPRVSLSCLGQQTNEMGLLTHVVAYGEARVTEGGAADLLRRPAQISMGPHLVFRPEPYRSNPGYITRIHPMRCGGVGPWSEAQS